MSIDSSEKRRGRPRADTEAVNVRLGRDMLDKLDAMIRSMPDRVSSRPDAVRHALSMVLGEEKPTTKTELEIVIPQLDYLNFCDWLEDRDFTVDRREFEMFRREDGTLMYRVRIVFDEMAEAMFTKLRWH